MCKLKFIFMRPLTSSGKPANLSSNCYKHVLAELKRSHVDSVWRTHSSKPTRKTPQVSATTLIDSIPPPTWSAAVLSGLWPDDGIATRKMELPPGTQMAALQDIVDTLETADRSTSNRSAKRKVEEYTHALATLAAATASEVARVSKKPRGNHGFLVAVFKPFSFYSFAAVIAVQS